MGPRLLARFDLGQDPPNGWVLGHGPGGLALFVLRGNIRLVADQDPDHLLVVAAGRRQRRVIRQAGCFMFIGWTFNTIMTQFSGISRKTVEVMKRYTNAIAVSVIMLLFVSAPAVARSVGFHPRLEMGTMQYEFESEAFSRTIPSVFYNRTLSEYKYEDVMHFVSAGMTIFVKRVFVDVSGQYSFNGNDSDQLTRSRYTITRFYSQDEFPLIRILCRLPSK
jgi:hypothetical protein